MMPSIADATRTQTGRERWRLAAGVALLVFGTLIAGLGVAGVIGAASMRTGGAIGGLALLAGLLAVAANTSLDEREEAAALVGLGIAFAGVSAFWAVTPIDVSSGPLALSIVSGIAFLVGVAIVLAAVLAAVSIRLGAPTRGNASQTVGWTRSDDARNANQPSADGGREDEDLSFPIDDEP